MATAIASLAQSMFTRLLELCGETVTISLRASTVSYDSAGYLADTSTQYGSATAYTAACSSGVRRDSQYYATFEKAGIKVQDVLTTYFRHSASIEEGAKLTAGGKVYFVKYVEAPEDSYTKVISVRASGQEWNA